MDTFLAEPRIAALAVDAGADRAPLTVPIWYQYEPGGEVWIMTGLDSRKNKLIGEAGRFSLMVDRLEPTIRYVSVEGPVVETVTATEEHLREISARYLQPEGRRLRRLRLGQPRRAGPRSDAPRERWVSSDLGSV
ncbi:Pyridoxamine 5'-phosphate oxidase family protein OS=Streptomyces tendae OX=1932 GN=GUR47_27040 PE=4 SV=1 [Streptomyces tendae]